MDTAWLACRMDIIEHTTLKLTVQHRSRYKIAYEKFSSVQLEIHIVHLTK